MSPAPETPPLSRFDVVIGGGGLAGLTLARQLRREVPEATVAVVERQRRPLPVAAHKVGESSVELASHYFAVVLGLDAYLREKHYVKHGLRFFPGGGATHALEDRTEIGPPERAQVPSFQLDRGRFEHDLRDMNEEAGVVLLEGHVVKDVDLAEGDGDHVVHVEAVDGGEPRQLLAGYYVDASGRRGLLRAKLGLTRPSDHPMNAAWWRVAGRVDVADLVPRGRAAWHQHDPEHIRWYSTVHFMGTGYWLWYIPLAPGSDGQAHTSIGIVVHDAHHSFDAIRTRERALAWVERHEPRCHAQIRDLEPLDFLCLKHYSHTSARVFSPQRWSLIGDAGAFSDPFYSPGSDFIALANSYTVELVKAHLGGGDVAALADRFDRFYLGFVDVTTETYRKAAPVYGSPRVLPAKIYWDNFVYWSFVCQYFFRGLHRHHGPRHDRFEAIAAGFEALQYRTQKLLSEWARRADNTPRAAHILLPVIPSMLANLHLDLLRDMGPDETLEYMEEKLELAREVLCELALRALAGLTAADRDDLARAVDLPAWPDRPGAARLAAEAEVGGRRRRALPPIIRDMERCLGRIDADAAELAAIVDRAFSPAT